MLHACDPELVADLVNGPRAVGLQLHEEYPVVPHDCVVGPEGLAPRTLLVLGERHGVFMHEPSRSSLGRWAASHARESCKERLAPVVQLVEPAVARTSHTG